MSKSVGSVVRRPGVNDSSVTDYCVLLGKLLCLYGPCFPSL